MAMRGANLSDSWVEFFFQSASDFLNGSSKQEYICFFYDVFLLNTRLYFCLDFSQLRICRLGPIFMKDAESAEANKKKTNSSYRENSSKIGSFGYKNGQSFFLNTRLYSSTALYICFFLMMFSYIPVLPCIYVFKLRIYYIPALYGRPIFSLTCFCPPVFVQSISSNPNLT